MIKHWRLFDSVTAEQIKQLDIARIYVKIEDDVTEFEFPLVGRKQFVKNQDVYITTTNEKQETLIQLLFPGNLLLIEAHNDQYR
jgi:hypothetical protein